MKRGILIGVAIAGIGAAIVYWAVLPWMYGPRPQGEPTPRPSGAEWMDLLAEEYAAGWENITDDREIFGIEDGVLEIYGHSILPLRYVGYVAEEFGDFDLHLEYRVSRRANSGVFFRTHPDDPTYRGFEVQILDDHGKPPHRHRSGGIYDVVTPMFNMSRPTGEWNSFDVRLRGHEVIVFMNGWRVVHTDLSKMTEPIGKFATPFAELPLEGVLALQDHGGQTWFRNIMVRRHADMDEQALRESPPW